MSSVVVSTPIKTCVFNSSQSSLNSTQESLSRSSSQLDLSGYNTSPATRPEGRDNKAGWYNMHEKYDSMCKRHGTEYIFCGDSIIAGLSRYSHIWKKFFGHLRALNFGIGGDRTQHVLWRAENMNIPSSTKFVVIHCGTNNIDRDQPGCIANGILSVAVTFQEKLPGVNIIVTGLLPRDLYASYRREKVKKVNKILKKMCKTQFENIHYMKQDDDWVLDGGMLDASLYYTDHLHLIEKGNLKFSTSILEALKQVEDHGKMEYSSGEEESEEEEEQHTYHRQAGENRRKRSRISNVEEDDFRSKSSKKSRRSDEDHHRHHVSSSSSSRRSKHRRHSSPPRRKREHSESPPVPTKRKRESSEENTTTNQSAESSKNKWKVAREKGNKISHEKKSVEKTEESPEKVEEDGKAAVKVEPVGDDGPLSGTAKSIDIGLDERKRKEARRNKFAMPTSFNPSALVKKIFQSKTKAKEDQKSKKRKLKEESVEKKQKHSKVAVEDDDDTSQNHSLAKERMEMDTDSEAAPAEVDVKTKKFFSDFTADSDSE